jgi:1,4-dihydroxy-2-naphthoyl-CoA synthase
MTETTSARTGTERGAEPAGFDARRGRGLRSGGMSYETLRYEQSDHVVTLTFDRPEQHNAVNRVMNRELHDAWQRFRDDDEAFVLVITGAGETSFCAG